MAVWRRHILIWILGFVLTLGFYHDTVRHLFTIIWRVDSYSHGLLVPLISAYLVLEKREALQTLNPVMSRTGIAIFFASGLVWFLGGVAETKFIQHLALVASLVSLSWAVFGWEVLRRLAFPALFLFLMVPFGETWVGPLQTIAARLAIGVLSIIGVVQEAEGVLITLSTGVYEVAEACSGVRFLMTSLVTGILLSHIAFRSWRRKVLLLAAALTVPVFINVARIVTILLIAEANGAVNGAGIDHVAYGWGFLSVSLVILIAVAYRFSDKDLTELAAPEDSAPSSALSAAKPALGFTGFIVMVPIMFGFLALKASYTVPNVVAFPQILCNDCDFRALEDVSPDYRPVMRNVSREREGLMRRGGDLVLLYAGAYDHQGPGAQLVQNGNSLETGGWQTLAGYANSKPISNRRYQEYMLWRGEERMLLWRGYIIGGRWQTGRALMVKIYNAYQRIMGGSVSGMMITIATPMTGTVDAARNTLSDYVEILERDWRQNCKDAETGIILCAA